MGYIELLNERIEKNKENIHILNEKEEKIKERVNKALADLRKYMIKLGVFSEQEIFDVENQYGNYHYYSKLYADYIWYNTFLNKFTKFSNAAKALYSVQYDIKQANILLNKNMKKLNEEVSKSQALDQYILNEVPDIIKQFLLNWKERVKCQIREIAVRYKHDVLNCRLELKRLTESDASTDEFIKCYEKYKHEEYDLPLFQIYRYYNYFRNDMVIEFFEEYLEVELNKEMRTRLLNLMKNVGRITGRVVNADLHIGIDGNLNGIIYGEMGNAKIETIGAGGYNIQCYHYRCLIHKI